MIKKIFTGNRFCLFSYFIIFITMIVFTLGQGLWQKIFLDSMNLLYSFYAFLFYLTSFLGGILYKVTKSKCNPNCEQRRYDLATMTLRFITWLLLFLGASYSFYIFEYLLIFNILGTIMDGIIAVILILFFTKAYNTINKTLEITDD